MAAIEGHLIASSQAHGELWKRQNHLVIAAPPMLELDAPPALPDWE